VGRAGGLRRRERAVTNFLRFEHRAHLQNLHHTSRVADSGQLHQNFKFGVGAAVLLNRRFGQPQAVDAVFNGRDGLNDGVILQAGERGWGQ
jgi:hypothetical protein